ncbi:MAG: class I SAM-dependent methyltransferase [Gemmatimonadota bacterium]
MPPRFVARQLARPSGLLGPLFGRLMNWHNATLNAYALEQVALAGKDRVLEIGFGGGAALASLLTRARCVAGLDRSRAAVRMAHKRYADQVAAGCAQFRVGQVEALPYQGGDFSWVYSVNTVYFWPILDLAFGEIFRVLRPGGRVVIGFLPKQHMDRLGMPTDIFTTRSIQEMVSALDRSGFHGIEIRRPAPDVLWAVIVAQRP